MSRGCRVMLAGLVAVFGVAGTCLAGAMYQNTSGAVARAIRIEFSEPAEITSMWPNFPQREPQGPATVIVLSGGEIAAGGWFSFSWRPDAARVVRLDWLSAEHQTSYGAEPIVGVCSYVVSPSGRVVTSITGADLRRAGISYGDEISVSVGTAVINMAFDYPDRQGLPGIPIAFLLWGDLHLHLWEGSLASTYGVSSGMAIAVRMGEKGKYTRSADDLDRYWESVPIDVTSLPEPLSPVFPAASGLRVEGHQLVDSSGVPVVLRGVAVEDPYWAKHEHHPVLRRDLVMIQVWGGNVVHIPVHPEAWKLVGGSSYLYDHLDDVVRWAGELGLYAIISWKTHGDPETKRVSEEKYDPDMVLARQALAGIARRYRDCPWVLYSVFNEPGSFVRWERFRACMTALVDAVREQNPNSVVLIPGVMVAADLSSIPSAPIDRANILYAADVYPWVWDKMPFREDALALLAAGYPLFIFEWGFDIAEDSMRFPYTCQTATSAEFGEPLVQFCAEHGIGWTAWIWTHDWCPHMFYDFERSQLTPFGDLVRDTLGGWSDGSPIRRLSAPEISIEPSAAEAAGCSASDRLAGNWNRIPSTVIEATPSPGWEFSRWDGPVDLPASLLASVGLGTEAARVTAIFKPSVCAAVYDSVDVDNLVIDGFSPEAASSSGLVRWNAFGYQPPTQKPMFSSWAYGHHVIRYSYPEDGSTKLALGFHTPFDARAFAGVQVMLRADGDVPVRVEVASQDRGLHLKENPYDWKSSAPPCSINVGVGPSVFRLPFAVFADPLWMRLRYPDVTPGVNTEAIFEIGFFPECTQCVLEMLEVSFYKD